MFGEGNDISSLLGESRLVILGGSGFVGSHLTEKSRALGLDHLSLSSSDIDLAAQGSVEKLTAIMRPEDTVVVLSALTPDKGRDVGSFERNIAMGISVANAVDEVKPRHVIYLSSDAVYPYAQGLIDELSTVEATSLYAAAHLAREALFNSVAGGRLTILRPTLIYGPGDPHASYGPTTFFRTATESGTIALYGGGEEFRDHVFIGDVVDVILRAAVSRVNGLFNVASGESIRYRDLAALVSSHVGDFVEVTSRPRKQDITHRHFDVLRLMNNLPGFCPTTISEGMAKTVSVLRGDG